jgi:hypothetical protein
LTAAFLKTLMRTRPPDPAGPNHEVPFATASPHILGNVVLGAFFLLIFAITIVDDWHFGRVGHPWVVGDWVINYSAGFVRRGLLGELLRRAATWSGIPMIYLVAGLQIVSHGIILSGVYVLCAPLRKTLWLVFFLVSPATLLFHVYVYDGGYQKEICFIAFLVILVVASRHPPDAGRMSAALPVLIATSALALVLAHEPLFLFFPYLAPVLAFTFRRDRSRLMIALVLSVFAGAVAFILSAWFHGDEGMALRICRSARSMISGANLCDGALLAFSWNPRGAYQGVMWHIDHNDYPRVYSAAAALSVIPYVMYLASRRQRLRDGRFRREVVGVPFLALLMSLPLFVVAVDWGRFIHLHLMCIFIVILCQEIGVPASKSASGVPRTAARALVLSLAIVYMATWRLPHCCHHRTDLDVNALFGRVRANAVEMWRQ